MIFYGSQTRTAERFAIELNGTLHEHGIRAVTANLLSLSVCVFLKLCNTKAVVIFIVSTYGEGDPPDDAQPFVHWLERNDAELKQLKYTVFGLGNSMYVHYNACGKLIDRSLRKLGAMRFYPLGLGDELVGLESAFLDWQTGLIDRLIEHLSLDLQLGSDQIFPGRMYKALPVGGNMFQKDSLYVGETKILGSYDKQIPPFNADNPFLAPVRVNRELHTSGSRSCRHIELDLCGSGIRYEAGDHVAVIPQNPRSVVDRLGTLLKIDLDRPISFIAIDSLNPVQQPFPCPCTYRTAFTHYVDITGPPRLSLLRIASCFASNANESERLLLLGSNTPVGKKMYSQWVLEERRSVVDVLDEFKSLTIPVDILLERLAPMKPRLYSISSSMKVHRNAIHLTCAVVQERTPTGRHFRGLLTTAMAGLDVRCSNGFGDCDVPRLPIYVRSSRFHLPKSFRIPIIMIASGTGLAPFRAFIQERCAHASQTDQETNMTLFFGCRRLSEDYIYAEELEKARRSGHLRLYLAFSRDSVDGSKVYVQHRIRDAADEVWQLIEQRHAHIYVCGSAKMMARDVHKCLVGVLQSRGGLTISAAEEYLTRLRNDGRYHLDVWS